MHCAAARRAVDGRDSSDAFDAVHGIKVQPTVVKGTTLSDIDPDQFISAVAARKPAF